MKIEHVALWVNDLEAIKEFYQTYFRLPPTNATTILRPALARTF